MFTKHGLYVNKKGKELAAMKIVSIIKYMLNNKTKEPIYIDWKADNVKEILENDNRREHQGQRYEE
jgi:hypothetical protein